MELLSITSILYLQDFFSEFFLTSVICFLSTEIVLNFSNKKGCMYNRTVEMKTSKDDPNRFEITLYICTQPRHQEEVQWLVLRSAVFTSGTHFYRKLTGPQDQSGQEGLKKNLCPSTTRVRTRAVQPVSKHPATWATYRHYNSPLS